MSMNWPDFNDLWDYNDPAGTAQKFRELLPDSLDEAYRLQLLTQIARAQGLDGDFDGANTLLDEVEAAMAGGDVVEVRYLLERGRALASSGKPAQAVPLFRRAVERAEQIGAHFYAVDALHMLGIAAPPEARLDWNLKAIAYVERVDDAYAARWLGSLYNNTGWTLFDEKRYDEALELFRKALAFHEQGDNLQRINIARWCIGKVLRVMGEVEAALTIQRELEASGDSDGFVEEEIAECLLALGKPDAARPYFKRAYEMLSEIEWVAADTERMERLERLGSSV